ncbi:hypothetical protein Tfer_3291 [Thermincola ferriacetica]|uniref:Uncharacterized protein n=1 Tax=Thermincola ferriacetica TaxID=281456 RepID=A0A0L6VYF0_9FIRM|nr:hypothetical protein Tfer_3291 [Thermincola ferriacetica]
MDLHTLPFLLISWVQFLVTILIIIFLPTWFFRKVRFFEQKLKDIESKLDNLSKK